jgi:hypothetical protein
MGWITSAFWLAFLTAEIRDLPAPLNVEAVRLRMVLLRSGMSQDEVAAILRLGMRLPVCHENLVPGAQHYWFGPAHTLTLRYVWRGRAEGWVFQEATLKRAGVRQLVAPAGGRPEKGNPKANRESGPVDPIEAAIRALQKT